MPINFLPTSSLAQSFSFFKIGAIICLLNSDAVLIMHVSVAFLEKGDEV